MGANHRWIRHAVLALISLNACGCLGSETQEVRCARAPDGGTWTVTQTFRNVGSVSTPFNSSPASPETQSEDFKGLLDLWKGDWPSEDTTGVEVTERILWVDGDMVCGRMRSVQPRLPEQFQLSTDSTSFEFGPIDSLTQIVETNGKTEPNAGGTVVRWPPDAKEIRLKVRGTEPVHPFSQAQREEIVRMGGTKPKE